MKISRKCLQNTYQLSTHKKRGKDVKDDDFYLEGYGLNFDDSVSDSELYVQMMSIRLISLASNSKY